MFISVTVSIDILLAINALCLNPLGRETANENSLNKQKHAFSYLIHKAFKVNRAMSSLLGDSLEITLTVHFK